VRSGWAVVTQIDLYHRARLRILDASAYDHRANGQCSKNRRFSVRFFGFSMKSLYLAKYSAFVRWHQVGRSGASIVYLPGLSFPAVGNFLSVATHPDMQDTTGIMVDYLGAGASDHSSEFPCTLAAHAECVASIITHLDCGPCAVVGYSMGGSVAISLAIQRPDLVSQLVVCEGNVTSGGGVATRRFASFSVDEFAAKEFPNILSMRRAAANAGDAQAAFVAGAWAHVDPRALHSNARSLVNLPEDFVERFLSLDIPRTFVYGEKTFPNKSGEITPDTPDPDLLAARGVSIATVPGVGHNLMLGNPDGFVEVLRQSLKRSQCAISVRH
jgi:pimeloyl-ACP methyl ester carboxylesterase